MTRATNITWHHSRVTHQTRKYITGQPGCTIWLTGLPSSGKSTIAFALEYKLIESHLYQAYVLDGDNIRHGLSKNLGFSPEDREENIRRISEVAKLFADAGLIVITSFISPYSSDRDKARALHESAGLPFIEVFVDTPIEVCEERDPKGLYAKARRGEIKDFTGVNTPYEVPSKPELIVNTVKSTLDEIVSGIFHYLSFNKLVG